MKQLVLLTVLGCTAALSGQEPTAVPATSQPVQESLVSQVEPYDILTTERLSGNWGGVRSRLEDRGIEFGLYLTSIYQHNVRGGVQTRNGHRITGIADYELTLDLETMGMLDGGRLYLLAESGWGNGIGEDRVGNYFGVNGYALGDEEIIVWELWYEQLLWDGTARIRIGRLDATVDFDTNAYANDAATQFINPALTQTGNIPFSDPGLGIQLVVMPADWVYMGLAALDAQATYNTTGFNTAFHDESHFIYHWELGLMPIWETAVGNLPGGYRVGLWYDPQPKDIFINDLGGQRQTYPVKTDDVGFYFNMDQMLFKEIPDDDADTEGLGVFFRYGFAHGDINEMEHFWSAGAQYQGLIPTREADILGFGFARGILSDELTTLTGGDQESVYELYYSIQLLPWLSITPDFQYIANPGATREGRDAFVAGLRMLMSF